MAFLYPNDVQTRGLLQATLIGETAGVEQRWTNDFRVTSTYHAIVISGLHISVLAITLLWIFRLLRFKRAPALLAAAVACWLYAFISGFNSPAVRASAGFTLFMAASYCFRKTRALNLLAAIGIVYLVLDPDQLFDPSFQLSFLSCAIIGSLAIPVMDRFTHPMRASVKRFDQITYDPQVEQRAAQWRVELRLAAETLRTWSGFSKPMAQFAVSKTVRVSVFIAEIVIISACVQFGLALPMISYFHRLSITGLSANIIVVPLLCVVVPLGFASILTGWHALAVLTRAVFELGRTDRNLARPVRAWMANRRGAALDRDCILGLACAHGLYHPAKPALYGTRSRFLASSFLYDLLAAVEAGSPSRHAGANRNRCKSRR
ncbi:MAG: ComEC/Rec2 family competence protein [Bryobacteraceae bacterium]